MNSIKDKAKGVLTPKENTDASRTAYRGENKRINQVASVIGRGKAQSLTKDQVTAARQHTSTPLTALEDPTTFGPPPKNLNFYDETGKPRGPTPITARDYSGSRTRPPQRIGYGGQQQQLQLTQGGEAQQQQLQLTQSGESQRSVPTPPTKPQPPPRLPARQNSHPDEYTGPPPPAYASPPPQTNQHNEEYLNQGAVNRLGQAGISVPGFGIGTTTTTTTSPQSPRGMSAAQVSELQARLSRTGISSPPPTSPSTSTQPAAAAAALSTGGGTTWAQKQHAMQTAATFNKDPSSVSFKDARSAATTANNFRERHGAQVASGFNTAHRLGNAGVAKLGGMLDRHTGGGTGGSPTSRFGGMLGGGSASGGVGTTSQAQTAPLQRHEGMLGGAAPTQKYAGMLGNTTAAASQPQNYTSDTQSDSDALAAAAAAKRKPPPPPKKEFLTGQPESGGDGPPPVPLASKPR